MAMSFEQAKRFLKNHYQDDVLDPDRIRADNEHWERVLGNAERCSNADLDFIDKFGEAATTYLALNRVWTPHLGYSGEPMRPRVPRSTEVSRMTGTSNTANTGIMHWMVSPGRVACNAKRAIMGVPYEQFWSEPKPCKRCLAKAVLVSIRTEQPGA